MTHVRHQFESIWLVVGVGIITRHPKIDSSFSPSEKHEMTHLDSFFDFILTQCNITVKDIAKKKKKKYDFVYVLTTISAMKALEAVFSRTIYCYIVAGCLVMATRPSPHPKISNLGYFKKE